jgi:alanine racemase
VYSLNFFLSCFVSMPRPIRAVLKPQVIAHNLIKIQGFNPDWHCMPVLKANAYGHGLKYVLDALKSAQSLAILEIEGAALIRQMGWAKPITLLEGCFDKADIAWAFDLQLDWVLHNQAQLENLTQWMSDAGPQLQHRPRLFVKLNTGMNRLGFTIEQAPQAIEQVQYLVDQFHWPQPVLMTHFANADAAEALEVQKPSPQSQYDALMALKPENWLSSLGNSAGVLNCAHLSGDIVRPGIAMYGASPGPKTADQYGLKPAMSLCSEVIAIQDVRVGQYVGYGSRWQAQRDSVMAVVACGYADGYPRHAPDGTPVWIQGHTVPLVGRVSMDMLTVDVTNLPGIRIGDPVELWGAHLPVDVVAKHCGTIGYELLCAVTARVPICVINDLPES